jgi:Arc/MetJ-type ribon-helix-helix transcriptional regulator
MAVQQTQMLPPQYVEDLQKDYGTQLTGLTATQLDTSKFAPQIAGQDQYQQDAYTLAGQGIGAYQPYLTQAAAYTGPGSQAAFMSPYQQDVIDTTMAEYDTQAQKGLSGIGLLAAKSGNLGGGREGVMRSEYSNKSDLNRALLLAGLQQQGFGQAQKAAQQAYMNQMQMGQGIQQFQAADVAGLGSMGATQQAQAQAQLDADREAARLAAYEPYERLGYQGQGIASIASGAPGQYQSSVTPNPTPLQTALGTGAVLSGIYGNVFNKGGAFPTGGYAS